MDLLVDIGNSRIKWGTPEDLRQGRIANGSCIDLLGLLAGEWNALERPAKVWVSSVAKEDVVKIFTDWIKGAWNLLPIQVKSYSYQLGVTNGYKKPSQLGVDRWMALLGARAVTHQASIVVDCGTATTIDSIDAAGRHLGGVILPGIQLMRVALLKNTAIPRFAEPAEYSPFAQDTASGIESAAVIATVCLVNSVAKNLRERIAGEVACVLTGGAAEALAGLLELAVYHEPNLVLKGLAQVAAQTTDT